jgi:hypothetical protein
MKIEIITSFNERYYNGIGKECVETWLKYWPTNLKLTCYVEEFQLPEQDRIKQISFTELGADYENFQNDPKYKNRVKIFSKKAYSIIHAFKNSTADRIIWIDADVLTLKDVPIEIIKNLCPNDTLLTYMRVWHHLDKANLQSSLVPSAESGVFAVNTEHQSFHQFADRYAEYYNKRLDKNIRRFYDGEVLGAVAKEFETSNKIIDLCQDFKKPYRTPIGHTILAPYLHHYKAKAAKSDFFNDE